MSKLKISSCFSTRYPTEIVRRIKQRDHKRSAIFVNQRIFMQSKLMRRRASLY